jgi:hypothetical protein
MIGWRPDGWQDFESMGSVLMNMVDSMIRLANFDYNSSKSIAGVCGMPDLGWWDTTIQA